MKCEKCKDTGRTTDLGCNWCICLAGLARASEHFRDEDMPRTAEWVTAVRTRIAALESQLPTPDEAQVLADIRAAIAKAPGYKQGGYRHIFFDPSGHCVRMTMTLAPIAPEPKKCPVCGSPPKRSGDFVRCNTETACVLASGYMSLDIWNRLAPAPKEAPHA